MIDKEKPDIVFGCHTLPEYNCLIIIPELTFKEKLVNLSCSIINGIRELFWLILATIGLSLQIGSLSYIAGIMFMKGSS